MLYRLPFIPGVTVDLRYRLNIRRRHGLSPVVKLLVVGVMRRLASSLTDQFRPTIVVLVVRLIVTSC